ncbi:MAG: hypothetical protein ACP6IS_08815 [Candidatus Asgardarchaeia archaeon]
MSSSRWFKPPINDPEIVDIYRTLNAYLNDKPEVLPNKSISPSGFGIPKSDEIKLLIENRLRMIEKYNIKDKELIKRFLSTIFIYQEKITRRDIHTLEYLVNNPTAQIKDLATFLNTTRVAAKAYLRRLIQKYRLRFYSLSDPTLFKLRHFVLFVTIPRDMIGLLRKILWTPFTMTLNLDTFAVYERKVDGWATFVVPNQERILNRFKDWVTALYKYKLLADYELQEIHKMSYGMNFFLFDGKDWSLEAHKNVIASYSFIRENTHYLQAPKFLEYAYPKKVKFTTKEFLIYILSAYNLKMSITEIRKLIKENFNIDISISTIWRIRKKYEKYYHPTVRVNNIMLDGSLMVYIEPYKNDDLSLDDLVKYFANAYPLYYIGVTSDGVICFLEVPSTKLASITYHLDSLFAEKVATYKIIPRYINIGRRPMTVLAPYWNEKRQYWEVPKNVFSTGAIEAEP